MGQERYQATAELLGVLAAPVRLAILDRLADGPAAVHQLTADVGETQPLISQHLRVLRSAHLIRATVSGRERIYALTDDHVAHIVRDAVRHTAETHPA